VESQSVVKSSPPSIISADLRIVGDLNSDGEIQVDGAIDGDIRTRSLLVGQTANIKGEIVADSVHVHGNINGQIKSRSVLLASTAHVVGDILHLDLAIETGAFLEGHCKRMVEKTEVQPEGKVNVVAKDEPGHGLAAKAKDAPPVAAASKGSASASGGTTTRSARTGRAETHADRILCSLRVFINSYKRGIQFLAPLASLNRDCAAARLRLSIALAAAFTRGAAPRSVHYAPGILIL